MASTLTASVAAVTTGVTQLLSSGNDRIDVRLQPTGVIFVGDSSVTTTTGYKLLANTDFRLGPAGDFGSRSGFTGSLWGVATTTTTTYIMSMS
jgi:hypothetical protein